MKEVVIKKQLIRWEVNLTSYQLNIIKSILVYANTPHAYFFSLYKS